MPYVSDNRIAFGANNMSSSRLSVMSVNEVEHGCSGSSAGVANKKKRLVQANPGGRVIEVESHPAKGTYSIV